MSCFINGMVGFSFAFLCWMAAGWFADWLDRRDEKRDLSSHEPAQKDPIGPE
jgi:hypothetical protein